MKVMRIIIWTLCVLIIGTIIYMTISTRTPEKLKYYLIKSPEIDEAYAELKNDMTIYEIDVHNAFVYDDAFHIERVYYLEDVGQLQVMLRCKNSKTQPLIENESLPFKTRITAVDTTGGESYRYVEASAEEVLGKSTGRYQYIMYSFDGIEIFFTNTIIRLGIYVNDKDGETDLSKADPLGEIAVYDGRQAISTSISKAEPKKFKLE